MIRMIALHCFFYDDCNGIPVFTQAILFDFDNAPLYTSFRSIKRLMELLPSGGYRAGYSIQAANVLGLRRRDRWTYSVSNSIYISNLLIRFYQTINDFSIMYSCQNLDVWCSNDAGDCIYEWPICWTSTRVATYPGTGRWYAALQIPAGIRQRGRTLWQSSTHLPDYGTIYLADNMRVTPSGIQNTGQGVLVMIGILRVTGIRGCASSTDNIIIPSSVLNMPTVYNNGLNCHSIFVLSGATWQ